MTLKKSFGQHFLHEKTVIQKIVDEVDPNETELIVEVGPGGGALTEKLASMKAKDKLILVEADRDLIAPLQNKYKNAKVIFEDAVTTSFDTHTKTLSWILVSNLPYNAAAAIIMNALTSLNQPKKMVVMVQKEQADRMLAKPGDLSLLSVAIQLYGAPKRLFNVKPGAFTPPPKVDSTVLAITPKAEIPTDAEQIIQLAKIGFSSRRKQLHRNLADTGVVTSETVKTRLKEMNLKETARAQELSIEQWIKLSRGIRKQA